MDTASFTSPIPKRATLRPRTFTTPTTAPPNGDGAYRRLLRALAGPASTPSFHWPQGPRRHRPSSAQHGRA